MKKALAIALMVAFSAVLAGASDTTSTQKHPTTKKATHKTLKKAHHEGGKKGKKGSGGTTTPSPK